MAPPRGYVFDAYGTLFDVHSIVEVGREITSDPMALSAVWRQKQLEYTWLRSLMGRYEDFWAVTGAALRHAIRRLGLTASEGQIGNLMAAYLRLACFPEVPEALARLAPRPCAILSNGAPRMLAAAVESSGLGPHLQHVLSVDAVRVFKPAPAVYALGPAALGIPTGELLFVTSNAWDAAGAKSCGYRVAWCNGRAPPRKSWGFPRTSSSPASISFHGSGSKGRRKRRGRSERSGPPSVSQVPVPALPLARQLLALDVGP